MRDHLEESWRLVSARGNNLVLIVSEKGLLYGGKVVFHQSDRESIAELLFRDGVRSLTFAARASVDEILTFLTIFDDTNLGWQHEADCVDKLWMLELREIKFQAIDKFDELDKHTHGEASQQYSATLQQLMGDMGALERLETNTPRKKGANPWGKTRWVGLNPQGIAYFCKELSAIDLSDKEGFWAGEDVTPGVTFAQTHGLFQLAAATSPPIATGSELKLMIERLISQQLLLDGKGMVSRIEESFRAPAPLGGLARAAFAQEVDADKIAKLIAREASDDLVETPRQIELALLMERHVKPPDEKLASLIVESETLPAARLLMEILYRRADADPLRLWIPHVDTMAFEYLEEIEKRATPASLVTMSGNGFVSALMRAPDAARRAMGIRLTPREELEAKRDDFLRELEAPELEVRMAAAHALRKLGDPTTGIYILNLLRRDESVKKLGKPAIREILQTLLVLGGDRYVPFLEQCLGVKAKKKQGFLGSAAKLVHNSALGDHAVLQALVRHGTPRAMEVVRTTFANPMAEDLKPYIMALRKDPEVLLEDVEAKAAKAVQEAQVRAASIASSSSVRAAPRGAEPQAAPMVSSSAGHSAKPSVGGAAPKAPAAGSGANPSEADKDARGQSLMDSLKGLFRRGK